MPVGFDTQNGQEGLGADHADAVGSSLDVVWAEAQLAGNQTLETQWTKAVG